MAFLADLHIHSRFSRATSKDLSPQSLDAWARVKGIDVLGTGDFTHPKWREELSQHLVLDAESGLYKLASPSAPLSFISERADALHEKTPLFCLQCEISSIYKKNGRVRKIHNLIYVPTLEDAERFSKRLETVGNIASDGRPIIGLDSRNLLEMLLETVPDGILIPAHIWTPWFSLFGSKSGFDDITECFEDLTPHIFALETGLSSDPPMNRYISALDSFALVSNSDAHSANKLGREANIFEGKPSFEGIFTAVKESARRSASQDTLPCRFMGTIEFFPEEGKYHLDGHRACNVSFNPFETKSNDMLCPVCHKPLTIGVLHRVMDLADRMEPGTLTYEPEYRSIMPLLEMTAEILGYGVGSNAVLREYGKILSSLGSELDVLCTLPLSDIYAYWDILGEACKRLREGNVLLDAGYDGNFGHVHLFAENELPTKRKKKTSTRALTAKSKESLCDLANYKKEKEESQKSVLQQNQFAYSSDQLIALKHDRSPVLVLAGPGSGKTHLLIGRIEYLIRKGTAPQKILAITFTRRAAESMQKRLVAYFSDTPLPENALPLCDTLHGFSWSIVKKVHEDAVLLSEEAAFRLFLAANPTLPSASAKKIWSAIALLREQCLLTSENRLWQYYALYQEKKAAEIAAPAFDFADLIQFATRYFSDYSCAHGAAFDCLFVDEIQDCSRANINLLQHLVAKDGSGFFGIGDPDQSIYGFRGALTDVSAALTSFWPSIAQIRLGESFRSSQGILNAANDIIGQSSCGTLCAHFERQAFLHSVSAPNDELEAQYIAHTIGKLLGYTSHSVQDVLTTNTNPYAGKLSPNDIAVLVRYRFLMPKIAKALQSAGIPYIAENEQAFWADPAIDHLLTLLEQDLGTRAIPPPLELLPWLEQQSFSGYNIGKNPSFLAMVAFWNECGSWDTFFERLAFQKKEETFRSMSERVRLLTIHASKGLEFAAVFMPAFEEGLVPTTSESRIRLGLAQEETGSREQDQLLLEEEKRLCYVGVTRASDILYISCAKSRLIFGKDFSFPPSSLWSKIQQYFEKSTLTKKVKRVYSEGTLF